MGLGFRASRSPAKRGLADGLRLTDADATMSALADVGLRPGYAVLGIIGPDSPNHRDALRGWTRKVAPGVIVRFAVSIRDRAARPWVDSAAAAAEADVDFIDSLGQRSGAGVVIMHLFDAWLRHAVARYPYAAFIGRADSDAVPSPQWLHADQDHRRGMKPLQADKQHQQPQRCIGAHSKHLQGG